MMFHIQNHIGHVPLYEAELKNPTICTNTICIDQRLWKVSNNKDLYMNEYKI